MPDVAEISPEKRTGVPPNLIGSRLREERERQKLSLRSLAGRIGVTASLLSQIETGQVNPSVDTLYGLSEGLRVPTCYFFENGDDHARHADAANEAHDSLIVSPSNRRFLSLAGGVLWESLLVSEEPDFEWCEVHYPAGSISADVTEKHAGRHYVLILEGEVTLQLESVDHPLKAGESIAFDASLPHQFRNEGTRAVRALIAVLKQREVGTDGLSCSGVTTD